MRINASIIKEEGERVSPHSKFYIWEDKLFEPVYYRGKKCKTYKAVTNLHRINKVKYRIEQMNKIPTISLDSGFKQKRNKKKYKTNRFDILDL